MCQECLKAAELLDVDNIQVEIIDLRSVKPLDEEMIYQSVRKTGRLIVVDGGWKTCGLAAEVSTLVVENCFESLKAPIRRITLPDCPAPASSSLETAYYPRVENIVETVKRLLTA
jgi:pyruvate dehydrogenase E1 component beta subunit